MAHNRLTLAALALAAGCAAPATNWYEEWPSAPMRDVAACERQWIAVRARRGGSDSKWPGLLTVAANSSRERALERQFMNTCMVERGHPPAR